MIFKRKQPTKPSRRHLSGESTPSPEPVYRRNQTLSSYRHGDDDTSMRKKTHELNRLRRKLLLICSVFVAITAIILVVMSQFTSRVVVILEDVDSDIPDHYVSAVNDYFNTNYLERFSFFRNDQQLLSFIQQKSPELADLTSIRSSGILTATTSFTFSARRPIAVWSIRGDDYFVDATGKAFLTNYFSTPDVSVIDENNLYITPGETTIASNRFLEFVGRIVSDIRLQGQDITSVTIPIGMARELDVKLKNVKYYFKLSIDRSPAEQAEDIAHTIRHLKGQGIKPKYVDLRVKGKAYYN